MCRGLVEHKDEHKCGDQEGVAAPSGHDGSHLLSASINIGCDGGGVGTIACHTVVFDLKVCVEI